MSDKVTVSAVDASTIQISLPDGLSVKAGEPVPLEVLEMVVSFARLQSTAPEAGGEPEAGWCVGGCGAQL